MSARDDLDTFVKRFGANAGYAVAFPGLVHAVVAETLREAADVLQAEFPDHASVFSPYVGSQIVARLRSMAEGEA